MRPTCQRLSRRSAEGGGAGAGRKVLIFSRWVRMLDLIERSLVWAGYKYTRLDGKTPVPERQRRVDDFNASPALFVFLISTPTGGLGLNLTSANKCAPLP
jgi:SNF2 family DNA or RNA helicase